MKLTEVAAGGLEIDPRKVTHYLFDLAHERGGPKGRFFLLFGFRIEDPETLMRALMNHGSDHDVASVEDREVATVYTVEGEIGSPDGRNPRTRTVWQMDAGSDVARFITTVPLPRDREVQ
jgi:hypothetical protein